MKKFLFFSLLFTISLLSAQTILEENFDASTSLPAGWASSVGTNGLGNTYNWGVTSEISFSPSNSAAVRYENVTGGLAEDWLITPMLDLTNYTSPKLSFYMRDSWSTNYGSQYSIRVSTTSQTDLASFTIVDSWLETAMNSAEFEQKSVDLSAYAGMQIYVAFVMVNDDGDNFIIDDVLFYNQVSDDAKLLAVNLPEYIAAGEFEITGTIENFGTNPITSIDVTWQVDGEGGATTTLSGLNIAPGETYDFVHPDLYTATIGDHIMDVSLSNLNGSNADLNLENDYQTINFTVASNSTTMVPLYEEFTSSTCAPCASFNTNVFNLSYLNTALQSSTLVKYQMNWPGSGDIYYTAEGGVRRAYYGVNGVPDLFINGNSSNASSASGLTAELGTYSAKPAFMDITTAAYALEGSTITGQATITPYISGDFRVYMAVVEVQTTGNVSSNGETSFEYVMMKMLPDAEGTSVNFVTDVPQTITLSADLSTTNVEELTDIRLVVWVQNYDTKEVMQSKFGLEGVLGVEDVSQTENVTIYPNPSNGIVHVNAKEPSKVEIFNTLGAKVFGQNEVTDQTTLELNHLDNGIYIITIENSSQKEQQKLIINK